MRLAKVTRVIDGDTIEVMVDAGFSTHLKRRLRLRNVETPEIFGSEREDGLKWREWVTRRLPKGSDVIIQTYKNKRGNDVKTFSRYVADVWYGESKRWLNEDLRQELQDEEGEGP